jgi:hypothetical protein
MTFDPLVLVVGILAFIAGVGFGAEWTARSLDRKE